MKSTLVKFSNFIFPGIVFIGISFVADAHAFDVIIRGLNVSANKGVYRCLIFKGEDGFPGIPSNAVQSVNGTVANREGSCVFKGLTPGTYAVSTFHDANSNGKLDKNVLGIPKERYGFSRDASRPFGPPRFDEASIDVKTDETLIINLK